MKNIYSLLLIFICISSCSGQERTNLPKDTLNEPKPIAAGHPKLIRTQGTSEFANIYCGLQDKAGNLWFGTAGEGVYRYDGKYFTQFTVQDGLTNNTVWSILEDTAGNIWFGTNNGICRYDGKTISAIPIVVANWSYRSLNNSLDPTEKNEVWSMMQDKSGTIWFGTRAGLYCYNGTDFTRFLDNINIVNEGNLQLKMVDDILEDRQGNIWFCSGMLPGGEGVCRYDGKSITSLKLNGSRWIRTVIEAKDGNLYFATRNSGVCRYDVDCEAAANTAKNIILSQCMTNITEKAGIDNASVTRILEDKKGNIWIATELGSGELGEDGGVWRYDGQSFTRFTTKEGLIHNGVFCMVEDKSENIWFGTRNMGLCRYDGKTFTHFSE